MNDEQGGNVLFDYYVDDVYVDRTPARVEICNTSTWAARTHCEIQIPSAWSSTSVTATANLTGFTNGSTVYVYVIDDTNTADPTGLAATVGAGGGTTYTVTPSAGANGSISPSSAQTVNSGSTTSFTVTPSGGYTASVGGTCGGSLVGTTYTTNAITANCTVSATFSAIPDTTAPVATISTADPSAISTNGLTVTGTASDAVGVSGCKWRIGSAPNASNGTACTGTTSFSCTSAGYSQGANTLYVGCYDAAGNYGYDSMTVNYCKKLSTPVGLVSTGLVANPPSNATISFDWSDVTTHTDSSALTGDLANYRLYWGTTSGGPYNTASSVPSAISVGPTQANITYYARVSAESSLNAICNSDTSPEISLFADTIAPTTPSGLTLTTASTTRIDLSWGASTDAVGVAGYNIERCVGSSCASWAEIRVTTGTGTTYSDTTLSQGTTYRYRVRARDAIPNYGGYSPIASATTYRLLSAPRAFKIVQ